jgi:hypothetical protein
LWTALPTGEAAKSNDDVTQITSYKREINLTNYTLQPFVAIMCDNNPSTRRSSSSMTSFQVAYSYLSAIEQIVANFRRHLVRLLIAPNHNYNAKSKGQEAGLLKKKGKEAREWTLCHFDQASCQIKLHDLYKKGPGRVQHRSNLYRQIVGAWVE